MHRDVNRHHWNSFSKNCVGKYKPGFDRITTGDRHAKYAFVSHQSASQFSVRSALYCNRSCSWAPMPRWKSSTIDTVFWYLSGVNNGSTDFKYFRSVSCSLGNGKCGKLSGFVGDTVVDRARFGDNVMTVSCWMDSFRLGTTVITSALVSNLVGVDFPMALDA